MPRQHLVFTRHVATDGSLQQRQWWQQGSRQPANYFLKAEQQIRCNPVLVACAGHLQPLQLPGRWGNQQLQMVMLPRHPEPPQGDHHRVRQVNPLTGMAARASCRLPNSKATRPVTCGPAEHQHNQAKLSNNAQCCHGRLVGTAHLASSPAQLFAPPQSLHAQHCLPVSRG